MNNFCKHTIKYLQPAPDIFHYERHWVRKLKICSDINIDPIFLTYDELTQAEKNTVDEDAKKTWMRCSEHCGNTVREAQ